MGLDVSLTGTGIEILDQDAERVYSSTVGYSLNGAKTEREAVERLVWIANEIVGLVKKFGVELVGVEGYAFGAKYGRERLAELHGVLKSQLFLSCQIIPSVVPPKTARSKVFGKGCGGIKKKFVRPLLKQRGVEIDDPDQADAHVVARYLRWRMLTDGKGRE